MDEPAAPSPRIGNAEREAAQHALDAHLEAGRLDAEEYGERSGRVSVARTAEDLTPLFADLPEPRPAPPRPAPPHPSSPPPPAGAPAGQPAASDLPAWAPAPAASTSGAAPAPATAGDGSSALDRIGSGVMAALPLLALVLFFVVPISNSWVFFLLIPLGGIVFARTRGRRRRDEDGNRDRDRDR